MIPYIMVEPKQWSEMIQAIEENVRLKAEVERRTTQYNGIIDTQLKVIDELKADIKDLREDRIRMCDVTIEDIAVIARLKAEVERLRKAGDAVALDYAERIEIEAGNPAKTLMKTVPVLRDWNAAKEGKPSV